MRFKFSKKEKFEKNKQKLQVSFEFKTSKTRFYKQPATRFEFSKKEKFEKMSKNHILYKNTINSGIFSFKILKKGKFASKIYKWNSQVKFTSKIYKGNLQVKIASKTCKEDLNLKQSK